MMPISFFQGIFRLVAVVAFSIVMVGPARADGSATSPWYDAVSNRLETTWTNERVELYLPLHVHHMRFAYTREKINCFNETPRGMR